MVSIFRQKSPGNIIILLIFGLLLKMPLFIYAKPIVALPNEGALYRGFIAALNTIATNNALLCAIISFLLLYVQSLLINYVVNDFRMLPKNTYLPGMSYMLITTLLPEWNYLSAALLASTVVFLILIKLLRLYNIAAAHGAVFNLGLLLGISSYIFLPSVAFIICILLGFVILKPLSINEVILFVMGCLTPYYFFAAYLFLKGQLNMAAFFPHISVQVPLVKSSIWLAISTILLAVPFLTGGYLVQFHLHKVLIQIRKHWSIVLLYLVLAFFIPFINSYQSFSNWALMTTPFAFFHASTYYYPVRKWLPNMLFFITTAFILYEQYGTKVWH